MLNFLIESHTSSSIEKLEDYMSFTLWSSILVSDPIVVYNIRDVDVVFFCSFMRKLC